MIRKEATKNTLWLIGILPLFLLGCTEESSDSDNTSVVTSGAATLEAKSITRTQSTQQYPIDPDYRKAILEIDQAANVECKDEPTWAFSRCWTEVRISYEPEGRLRGTDAYISRRYANLSVEQLLLKKKELSELLPRLRMISPSSQEDTAGELTRDRISIEISAIDELLRKVKKKMLKQECVEGYGPENAKTTCDHLQ